MAWTKEKLIKEMPKKHGVTPLYRLRWCFDFHNKPTRYGQWNGANQKPEEMAAFINKEGLVRASIQGCMIQRWHDETLVEVDGHNFASFSWEAAFNAPVFSKLTSYKNQGVVIGLSLLTRTEKISVFVDGSMRRRPLTGHELKFKLEEHTGGS